MSWCLLKTVCSASPERSISLISSTPPQSIQSLSDREEHRTWKGWGSELHTLSLVSPRWCPPCLPLLLMPGLLRHLWIKTLQNLLLWLMKVFKLRKGRSDGQLENTCGPQFLWLVKRWHRSRGIASQPGVFLLSRQKCFCFLVFLTSCVSLLYFFFSPLPPFPSSAKAKGDLHAWLQPCLVLFWSDQGTSVSRNASGRRGWDWLYMNLCFAVMRMCMQK